MRTRSPSSSSKKYKWFRQEVAGNGAAYTTPTSVHTVIIGVGFDITSYGTVGTSLNLFYLTDQSGKLIDEFAIFAFGANTSVPGWQVVSLPRRMYVPPGGSIINNIPNASHVQSFSLISTNLLDDALAIL